VLKPVNQAHPALIFDIPRIGARAGLTGYSVYSASDVGRF